MKKCIENGIIPQIQILEDLGAETDKSVANLRLNEAEVRWIKLCRDDGCDLLNLTNGGDGSVGKASGMLGKNHSEKTKEQIRRSLSGRPRPDEVCKKIGDGHRGKVMSEKSRKKMSESAKGHQRWNGRKHSLSSKEKMRKSQTGKKHSEETKAKMRASHLARRFK